MSIFNSLRSQNWTRLIFEKAENVWNSRTRKSEGIRISKHFLQKHQGLSINAAVLTPFRGCRYQNIILFVAWQGLGSLPRKEGVIHPKLRHSARSLAWYIAWNSNFFPHSRATSWYSRYTTKIAVIHQMLRKNFTPVFHVTV